MVRLSELSPVLFYLIGLIVGMCIILPYKPVKYVERVSVVKEPVYVNCGNVNKTKLLLLAVDKDGNGVTIPLEVEVRPGSGKVLTNIENLVFWTDTQHSIQIARDLAARITHRDPRSFDVIYTLEDANTSVVGGPSAGAAFTIATIAALEGIKLNNTVLITGAIDENGNIHEVGGIYEKAMAAKRAGAKIVLVPYGQGKEEKLVPEEKCIRTANFIYCETRYKRKVIDISEKVGIRVVEVKNIYDAIKYFFGNETRF